MVLEKGRKDTLPRPVPVLGPTLYFDFHGLLNQGPETGGGVYGGLGSREVRGVSEGGLGRTGPAWEGVETGGGVGFGWEG